jgi:hypothetical protein
MLLVQETKLLPHVTHNFGMTSISNTLNDNTTESRNWSCAANCFKYAVDAKYQLLECNLTCIFVQLLAIFMYIISITNITLKMKLVTS